MANTRQNASDPSLVIHLDDLDSDSEEENGTEENVAVVELVDADGCLYNHRYFVLLLLIIKNYHAQLHPTLSSTKTVLEIIQKFLSIVTNQTDLLINAAERKKSLEKELFDFAKKNFKNKYKNYKSIQKFWGGKESPQYKEKIIPDLLKEYIEYIKKLDENLIGDIILAANGPLISSIQMHQQSQKPVTMMIGSNRQTSMLDQLGIDKNGTGSIFDDLSNLATALDVKYDSFIMADVYRSFVKFINEEIYIFDETKLSLLYAFIHYIASKKENAGKKIELHFYDDKLDILAALLNVFKTYPALLPKNVKLHLHHYNGQMGKEEVIQGTGYIDRAYKENVPLMVRMCKHDFEDFLPSVDVAKTLNVQKFLNARRFYPMPITNYKIKQQAMTLFKAERKIHPIIIGPVTTAAYLNVETKKRSCNDKISTGKNIKTYELKKARYF